MRTNGFKFIIDLSKLNKCLIGAILPTIFIASQSHSQQIITSDQIVGAINSPSEYTERFDGLDDQSERALNLAFDEFGKVSRSVRTQSEFIKLGIECFSTTAIVAYEFSLSPSASKNSCVDFANKLPESVVIAEYASSDRGQYLVDLNQAGPTPLDFSVFEGASGGIGVVEIRGCSDAVTNINKSETSLDFETGAQVFCSFRIRKLSD